MATRQLAGPRPKVACEIGEERVIAARASQSAASIDMYSSRRLATGTLSAGLASPNVLQAEALRQAISGVLSAVAGNSKDVIAIIPDAAARVLLLDFENLPDKPEEAAAVIRFRVKKSLPFDVEHASLSYHVGAGQGLLQVVAALSPRDVIQEYESAFRDSGYAPGVVIPSALATLGLVNADRPTMVVKVDPNTVSVAIVNGSDLLLLRTLDRSGRSDITAQELSNQIHPSMVFYEDTYSARIEQILVTGLANIERLDNALQTEIGVAVNNLDSIADGESLGEPLPKSMLTSVGGALLSR
jgi:type IV pilus assembly protein PilM